jgi:hypothetical protein
MDMPKIVVAGNPIPMPAITVPHCGDQMGLDQRIGGKPVDIPDWVASCRVSDAAISADRAGPR